MSSQTLGQDLCADACDEPVPCYDVDLTAASDAYQLAFISGTGSCCANLPVNQNCAEIKIQLAPDAEGIQVSFDVGPNQCSINVYDGSLGCPTPEAIDAAPQVCDPICPELDNGIATILLCKPGFFNEIGFGFTGIPKPGIVPSPVLSEDCQATLTAVNIDNPVWSSPDDLNLSHLIDCNPPGDACGETVTFSYQGPSITDCDGIVYRYEVSGVAADGACASGNITGNGQVLVYPVFAIDNISAECTDPSSDEVTLSPNLSGGGASCPLLYEWTRSSDNSVVGSDPNLTLSPQDGQEYCVSIRRSIEVDACAVITACAVATASCCELQVSCPLENYPPDDHTFYYQCADEVPACADDLDSFNAIDASSNIVESCGLVTVSCLEQVFGDPGLGCPNDVQRIQRTYTITDDDTGESRQCVTNLYIKDETRPELSGCPVEALELECGADNSDAIQNWLNLVTATDNCGVAIVENDFDPENLDVLCEADEAGLLITFTATDACGNTATCEGEIKLVDTLAPELTGCPDSPLILECGDDNSQVISDWLSNVQASDQCRGVVLTNDFDPGNLAVLCSDEEDGLLVTFTATDECGKTSTCSATINLIDTTEPDFTHCPEEPLILVCGEDNEALIFEWLDQVGSEDSCGGSSVENDFDADELQPICADAEPGAGLLVTFTASDACGLTSECQGEIRLVTSALPTLSNCPSEPLVLECGDPANQGLAQEWLSAVSASGSCSPADVRHNFNPEDLSVLCSGEETGLVVIFTATDNCGNIATCEGEIKLIDSLAPELTNCPEEPLLLECGADNTVVLQSWLESVQASDQCRQITLTNDFQEEELTAICEGEGLLVRFTATDECGRTSSCEGEIRLLNSTPPYFTYCHEDNDLVLECGEDNQSAINAWLAQVTATDLCSSVEVSNDFDAEDLSSICQGQEGLLVTFTAADECGLTRTCSARIYLVDTTNPTFDYCPEDNPLILECGEENEIAIQEWIDAVTASDDCGSVTIGNDFSSGDLQSICAEGQGLLVNFTARDDCGLTASCQGIIYLLDTSAPSFDQELLPAEEITVDCNAIPEPAILTATDLCDGELLVQQGSEVVFGSGGCDAEYTIQRTWTAEDECGLTVTHTQLVHVENAGPPQFDNPDELPTNQTVSCDNVPEAATLTATGLCTAALVTFVEEKGNIICAGSYTLTRLWTATDQCGSQTTHLQTLIVEDNIAPQFDGELPPSEVVQSCDVAIDHATVLTASDNCATGVEVQFLEVRLEGDDNCPESYTIRRMWSVSDGCNSNSYEQILRIEDNDAPEMELPEVYNYNTDPGACEAALVIIDFPEASDSCDPDPKVVATRADGLSLFDPYPVGCTILDVVASDNCGNALPLQTQVCITDNQPPEFLTCPDNISSCNSIATWELPEVEDNCEAWITDVSHVSGAEFPLGETEVTLTVTDAQGNSNTCSFLVIINPMTVNILSSNYEGYGVRCRGGSDGWLRAMPSGGHGQERTYQWSNGLETALIEDLPAEMYEVMVTDEEGCQTFAARMVTEPVELTVQEQIEEILCPPPAEGSTEPDQGGRYSLTPQGGAGGYQYYWASEVSGFEDPGTAELNVLQGGTYYFTVTDANLCYVIGQADFEMPTPIVAEGNQESGSEGSSGNILPVYYNAEVIEISGGSGDYLFDWDRSGYVRYDVDNQYGEQGETLNILYADDAEWVVTITDINGCPGELIFSNDSGGGGGNPSVSDAGNILDIDYVSITGQSSDGNPGGSIDLTVVGGTEPYIFLWSGPGYSNGPSPNLEYIGNLDYGFYEVTVTDSGSPQQTTEGFYWVPKDRRAGRLKASERLQEQDLLISASPNPFSSSTNITAWIAESGNVRIELLDYQGRLVNVLMDTEQESDQLISFELGAGQYGLSAGMYIVKVVGIRNSSAIVKVVLVD